jgi:hypothetical protein
MFGVMNTRQQGDLGERAAVVWLLGRGVNVAYPFGHSPDWDLVAELDYKLVRIQVKTTTFFRHGRWEVTLCTRGGNQSWNGVVRRLDETRCDYLFVLVGDGRQWFIPAANLGGTSALRLGGPKYAAFEVSRGAPLLQSDGPRGDVRVVKGVRL